MNKLKLLVATICLIGCTGAAEIEPDNAEVQKIESKFDVFKSGLLEQVPIVAKKEFNDPKLARLVKFFEEPVTLLINSAEFARAYDELQEKALESLLRNLIFNTKLYKPIFPRPLYKSITSRLNVVAEEKKHGVLWVYLNELNYLYWN